MNTNCTVSKVISRVIILFIYVGKVRFAHGLTWPGLFSFTLVHMHMHILHCVYNLRDNVLI